MKEEIKDEIKKSSVLTPFIIGGMVGAGIALLLAPKSGKDLRKDIKDLADVSKEKITSVLGRGKELYEVNRSSMQKAVEAAKEAYAAEREKHRQAA
ncbi:MAG TPA: YtxH domain-containing protein [Nitrospirota bacterium]|nr:YtxH domain-containing protein [Nitrospirota bacterium]